MGRPKRIGAALAVAALLLAACTSGDDSGGGSDDGVVTMFGPEVEGELEGFQAAMAPFTEDTDIEVKISGDRSAEEQIGVQVQGGNPPDVFIFPQPGRLAEFAKSGDLKPLRDDVAEAVKRNFPEPFWSLAEVDGELYGVPNKADVKSLVWYSPKAFAEAGYAIPTTHTDFIALADKMVADGQTPFCIGIGSDAATGWPFTDWVEDYMLRLKGPDVYDQWVAHEIPFDDPDVVQVGNFVVDIWERPDYVFGGLQTVGATPFADSGLGVLKGDCMMHRQANFYEAQWPEGTDISEDGDVWAFYLPTVSDEFGQVLLSGGTLAAPFDDSDSTMDALLYLASPEYVTTRAEAQVGFLSSNVEVPADSYPNTAASVFLDLLAGSDVVRFDGSDLMPGKIGSGAFWTAAVDIVNGSKTVDEAFTDVETEWSTDS